MKIANFLIIIITAFVGCNGCNNIKKANSVKSSISINAPTYVPMKEFNGDTLRYLETNFLNRKEYYINKNLGILLNDLEMPVKLHYYWDNFNNESISTGISLVFMNKEQFYQNRRDPESRKILNIKWAKPISTDTSLELIRENKGLWTKKEISYYKNQTIGDISMIGKTVN